MAAINKLSPLPEIFNQKVSAVEKTLLQTLNCFKDLVEEFERIHIESLSYKSQYMILKEKCESKCCSSSETMSKEIETKNNTIQQIASALTTLLETKNMSIVNEILRLICADTNLDDLISPKKELLEKSQSIQDESVSEIEGTPTGRKSPIISSRKVKNNTTNGLSLSKKKCPDTWETPEKKNMKLLYPSPSRTKSGGRMKQSRLNLVKVKSSCVVDLTCSPETLGKAMSEMEFKPNIKKEFIDNDETILPSPTSGLPLSQIFPTKSLTRSSPNKFRKPSTPLKFKIEEETMLEDNFADKKNSPTYTQSIDLAKISKKSPKKSTNIAHHDENMECDADNSISLLQQNRNPCSPTKGPLIENNNLMNVPQEDIESSLSILRSNLQVNKVSPTGDKPKRIKPEEPVYKEPTVRKKSEKRALRGWSCDECRNFYGALYKDNPEMLEQKMDECSKHRGKNNPVRPKTPPGFWEPRWDVPTDTEEFNRRNDAI